jgi:hypothetical protein
VGATLTSVKSDRIRYRAAFHRGPRVRRRCSWGAGIVGGSRKWQPRDHGHREERISVAFSDPLAASVRFVAANLLQIGGAGTSWIELGGRTLRQYLASGGGPTRCLRLSAWAAWPPWAPSASHPKPPPPNGGGGGAGSGDLPDHVDHSWLGAGPARCLTERLGLRRRRYVQMEPRLAAPLRLKCAHWDLR